MAVAGFLAGHGGCNRASYATDLRLSTTWCHEGHLTLLTIKRAHIELFGRWIEKTGRMRSAVARRLPTATKTAHRA
jgi:integrase/recombinase XerD